MDNPAYSSVNQAVIFAGGLGTRFSEETSNKPKPMIEIGTMPILWHIMKLYHHQGVKKFVICAGYKQEVIKNFFLNYRAYHSDLVINFGNDQVSYLNKKHEDWQVTIVNTGMESQTAYRLKKVEPFLDDQFYLTYGDGLADINLQLLDKVHVSGGAVVTLTAVQPKGRFGALDMQEGNWVSEFREKPIGDGHWVNGGFFRVNKNFFDLFPVILPEVTFEDCLADLADNGQLLAHKHKGFWAPMDTLRDYNVLNQMFEDNVAPWKLWND